MMEAPLQPGQRRVALADALSEISAFEREDRLAEADDLARRVVEAAPEHPHALHMAAIVAYRRGRLAEAIERMEQSIRLAPETPLYPRNICEIYRGAGRLDDALDMGRRAVALAPNDARAHFNLALIHYERLELDEAVERAEAAIALQPDFPEAHFEKAEALLLAGHLREGWESYEWRFKLKQAEGMLPDTGKPQWDGAPLPPGRLLMVADQGLGDCIQFARFIPFAVARAPAPVLACSHELLPVLQQQQGIGNFITRWDEAAGTECYIPLSGLPRLAGITPANIPASAGYLEVPAPRVEAWRTRLARLVPGSRRRIALVWAGRPTHKNDRKRSLRLSQFSPLFDLDVALIAVQKGPEIAQAGAYYGGAPLLNLGPIIGDLTDTMAILRNVEHLVTIDTSVAHLAGAIGVPTSLVLPYAPDWRWLLGRADTPWYRSLRLYRQQRPYDWSGVVERVAADLAAAR